MFCFFHFSDGKHSIALKWRHVADTVILTRCLWILPSQAPDGKGELSESDERRCLVTSLLKSISHFITFKAEFCVHPT